MIAKNEADNLPRALASVAGVADEVIVVDTGSTDDTVAVAKRLGAKVGHVEWRNDFAAARNAAIAMATAAWLLILDADEELAPESVEPLRRIVSREPTGPVLLVATTESRLDTGQASRTELPRVLPNIPCLRYRRPIHEQLGNVEGGPAPLVPAPELVIIHHGYSAAERTRKVKVERNLSMLLAALEQDPDDVASRYYVGLEYWAAGMHAASAQLFAGWLERIEQAVPRTGALHARQAYSASLEALGRTGEAAAVAVDGASRHRSAGLGAIAAHVLVAEDPATAERLAHQAIDMAASAVGEPWAPETIRAEALTALGNLRRQAGDVEGARRQYQAAAGADPIAARPRMGLADLSADAGDLTGARLILLDALAVAPADVTAQLALARLERRMGLLQEPFDRLTTQVAATPRNLDLRLELAEVLYAASEHALGADVLAAAEELPELAAAPPAFRAHYFARLAFGCVEAQRFEAATRAFQCAFQADPDLAARAPRAADLASGYRGVPSEAAAGPAVPAGRA